MPTDNNRIKNQESPPSKRTLVLLALYLLLFSALAASFLVMVWDAGIATDNATEVSLFGINTELSGERQLLCIVISAGTLGGLLYALSSFVSYVGTRTFVRSWTLWYILRPFIGMPLALIAYFVFRGLLFSTQANAAEANAYGFAALAGLAGLFSKQTLDKLKEVLETLFTSKQDLERTDKMSANKDRE